MRTLYVIASMDPLTGGTAQAVRASIIELNKLNVYAEVVSLDEPDSLFLAKDSILIQALEAGKGPWCYSSKLLPWLKENIDRFDVVIINGLWLYPSYAVWKAIHYLKTNRAKNTKTPKFFVMPHGMLDPWFQHAEKREWKAVRNWLYWKLIERKIINDADGLLFTCETEMLLARKPFRPYHPKKEINIGYGIEEPPPVCDSMHKAFLEKCPEVRNQPYLLFLSRIHPKKGLDLLLQAYSDIALAKPAMIVNMPTLVVAGPGLETSYGQDMVGMVAKNHWLNGKILFPGMLSGDAKWGALYGCEAFILPSHQENFGIAVVEALACKKPVLLSNQVNIWREIEAGGGGLVANDSVDGTKQLLANWFNLSDERKQLMGNKARVVFETYFYIKQTTTRLLDALQIS